MPFVFVTGKWFQTMVPCSFGFLIHLIVWYPYRYFMGNVDTNRTGESFEDSEADGGRET